MSSDRDYPSRSWGQQQLSPDAMMFEMIQENTRVTRQNRDVLITLTEQVAELRRDAMHLSHQAVGHAYRLWQLEAAMQGQKTAPPPKQEGLLWAFKGAWDLFSPPAKLTLIVILPLIGFGLVQPHEARDLVRGWIGLPPSASTPPPGGSSAR